MDRIGYVVTNNFILVGVDTNLVLTMGEVGEEVSLRLSDARKVHLLTPTTAVSVVGLPSKAGDIYRYLDTLENTQHSFDEVVEDVASLFNSNLEEIKRQLLLVSDVVMNTLDGNGAVQPDQIRAHFAGQPEMLQIVEEALQLVTGNNPRATQFFVFGHEAGRYLVARYVVIGTNISGHRLDDLSADHFDFVLTTSLGNNTKLDELEDMYRQLLGGSITPGWEQDPAQVQEFKDKAQEYITQGLQFSNPFADMKPNIVFYELSPATGFVFQEPSQFLRKITISRG